MDYWTVVQYQIRGAPLLSENAGDFSDPTQEGAAEHGGALSWEANPVGPKVNTTHSWQRARNFVAETSPWIAIVDDDPAVLRALSRLLRSRALRVKTFESGQEFLAALPDSLPECLIVDFQMPEMNGLELQQHLVRNGIAIPAILITAHGDAAIYAPPAGEMFVASLRKPLQDDVLFSAIDRSTGSSPRAG